MLSNVIRYCLYASPLSSTVACASATSLLLASVLEAYGSIETEEARITKLILLCTLVVASGKMINDIINKLAITQYGCSVAKNARTMFFHAGLAPFPDDGTPEALLQYTKTSKLDKA